MYIFVRLTAAVLMIIGILIMIAAIVYGVFGLVNGATPTPQAPGFPRMQLNLTGILVVAAFAFFQGLLVTAAGQLMLVFVDIARNTDDTVTLLRAMRVEQEL